MRLSEAPPGTSAGSLGLGGITARAGPHHCRRDNRASAGVPRAQCSAPPGRQEAGMELTLESKQSPFPQGDPQVELR